eukprot:UN05140
MSHQNSCCRYVIKNSYLKREMKILLKLTALKRSCEILDLFDPETDLQKFAHKEKKVQGGVVLKNKVEVNQKNEVVDEVLDFPFCGVNYFRLPEFQYVQNKIHKRNWWRIGVIHGPSGSGKSSLRKLFFDSPPEIKWDDKSIITHFEEGEIVKEIFETVQLDLRHTLKPFHVLSQGEKFRTRLARILEYSYKNKNKEDIVVIDESTSVLDRDTAKNLSANFNTFIKKYDLKQFVLVSCHNDYLKNIELNWAFETQTQTYLEFGSGPAQLERISDASNFNNLNIFNESHKEYDLPKRSDPKLSINIEHNSEKSRPKSKFGAAIKQFKDFIDPENTFRNDYIETFLIKSDGNLNLAIDIFLKIEEHSETGKNLATPVVSDDEKEESDLEVEEGIQDTYLKFLLDSVRQSLNGMGYTKIDENLLLKCLRVQKYNEEETIFDYISVISLEDTKHKKNVNNEEIDEKSIEEKSKSGPVESQFRSGNIAFLSLLGESDDEDEEQDVHQFYDNNGIVAQRNYRDPFSYGMTKQFHWNYNMNTKLSVNESGVDYELWNAIDDRQVVAVELPELHIEIKKCDWREWKHR